MFILYIVLPFIISLSVIGYGFILTKFLNLKHVTHNIGLVGIIGLFFFINHFKLYSFVLCTWLYP